MALHAPLVLDSLPNRLRHVVQHVDRPLDRTDGHHGVVGGVPNGADLVMDFLRRLLGLVRKDLDLLRHDREAAPGIAGSRGLDGRIEGQQIDLYRDFLDERDHVSDAGGMLAEGRHDPRRFTDLDGGLVGDRRGLPPPEG